MCHPILVLRLFSKTSTLPMKESEQSGTPLKTEVIYHVDNLDVAPPEWRIGDVRSLAKTSFVTAGSNTLGVAVGSRQFITDQLLSKADVIRAIHERVQLCQDPGSRPHHPGGKMQRRFTAKLGNGPLNGSSLVSRRTARHKKPSVQASLGLGSKERGTLLLQLIWEPSSQPNRASRA